MPSSTDSAAQDRDEQIIASNNDLQCSYDATVRFADRHNNFPIPSPRLIAIQIATPRLPLLEDDRPPWLMLVVGAGHITRHSPHGLTFLIHDDHGSEIALLRLAHTPQIRVLK